MGKVTISAIKADVGATSVTATSIPRCADYIRRMGPFEPGRLPHEAMEYTTMPEVAERMRERWEPIEPAPAEPVGVPAG